MLLSVLFSLICVMLILTHVALRSVRFQGWFRTRVTSWTILLTPLELSEYSVFYGYMKCVYFVWLSVCLAVCLSAYQESVVISFIG